MNDVISCSTQAIDEAKKRAVMQRVDYDTFRNMVLVAHLKPITAPSERQDGEQQSCGGGRGGGGGQSTLSHTL